MRIVFISGYYYPEKTADTHLNQDIVEAFSNAGNDVKVIVPFPSRGIDKETQSEYLKKRREKINDNLEIIRVGSIKKYKKSFFRKFLFLMKNTRLLYKEVNKHEADVYFIVSTPPFLGKIAIKLHKKGKKVVYKLQDVFPDSLIHSKGLKESGLLIRLLRKFEKTVYNSADRIITCSDDVKNTLINRGVNEEKIDTIFDWVDENSCVPIKREDNPLIAKYGFNDNDFIVSYAGNLGYLQDIDSFLLAADELRETDIRFLIVGNGVREDVIKRRIGEMGLQSLVRLYPMLPVEMASYVYSVGDIGVVLLNNDITDYAFPSKTWSIMSSGRMVLCESKSTSQLAKMITEKELGESFDPNDHEMLANLIRYYYNNKSECLKKGQNARLFITNNLNKQRAISRIFKCVGIVNKEN